MLIVTAPALRWSDLASSDVPNLEQFLAHSSVGLLSLRTLGARTSLGEGYVTIGSGNRASVSTAIAGLALEPTEHFEEGTAAQAYARRTGIDPTGQLLHLGYPAIARLNSGYLYGAEPGALGAALLDAGRSIGVVANGDLGIALPADPVPTEPTPPDTPAGEEETPPPDAAAPDEPATDEPTDPGPVTDSEDPSTPQRSFADTDYGRAAALWWASTTRARCPTVRQTASSCAIPPPPTASATTAPTSSTPSRRCGRTSTWRSSSCRTSTEPTPTGARPLAPPPTGCGRRRWRRRTISSAPCSRLRVRTRP